LLGEGVVLDSWINEGEDFWYLEGIHEKKVDYGGVEIRNHNSISVLFDVRSDKMKLSNGLAVGDSVDKILNLYPSFIDDYKCYKAKGIYKDQAYGRQGMDELRGVYVYVSDNVVERIIVGRIFDGTFK